jgi:hypothetical protein
MQTNVGSLLSYLLIYLLHTDKSVYICSIVIDSPRLETTTEHHESYVIMS